MIQLLENDMSILVKKVETKIREAGIFLFLVTHNLAPPRLVHTKTTNTNTTSANKGRTVREAGRDIQRMDELVFVLTERSREEYSHKPNLFDSRLKGHLHSNKDSWEKKMSQNMSLMIHEAR